jgi:hypothetical protein
MLLLQRRSVRSPHDAHVIACDATTPLSQVTVQMWQQARIPVQMWAGVSPVPVRMCAGVSPVLVQMWVGGEPDRQLVSANACRRYLGEGSNASRWDIAVIELQTGRTDVLTYSEYRCC